MTLLDSYKAEKARLRGSLVVVAILSFLASLCMLAIPLYLFQVYDRVIFSRSYETLIALSIIAAIVLVTYGLLDTLRSNMLTRMGAQFEANLAGPIIAGELSRPNDAQQSTLRHLSSLAQVLQSNVLPSIFDLPTMFVFLALVFLVHPLMGAVVAVGMVVLFITAVVGELITSRFTRESQEADGQARRRLDAAYRQHELVKALGMFREVVLDWSAEKGKSLANSVAASERQNALSAFSKTTRQVLQIVLIGTGAYLVLGDQVSAGVIFASSIIGSRALAPIEAIVGSWKSLKVAQLSMKTLEARLSRLSLPDQLTPLPRPKGNIVLEQLVYAPPALGAQPLLRGISGGIGAGMSVAIVGPSGAGKSTLARCIVGYLEPSRGKVTLDGQSLASWDPVVRGLYMGYLPQQVEFFDGTIAENIARLRRGDPAELVVEAAQFAGVHELIMSFPQGYDTPISSAGFQPSGGQRQLLGLARAFYGAPVVVVLDEPNANLDAEGEKILHRTIKRAKADNITVIIVTQRMSILQHLDKVLELKAGSVERFTDASEVLKSNVRSINASVQGVPRATAGDAS